MHPPTGIMLVLHAPHSALMPHASRLTLTLCNLNILCMCMRVVMLAFARPHASRSRQYPEHRMCMCMRAARACACPCRLCMSFLLNVLLTATTVAAPLVIQPRSPWLTLERVCAFGSTGQLGNWATGQQGNWCQVGTTGQPGDGGRARRRHNLPTFLPSDLRIFLPSLPSFLPSFLLYLPTSPEIRICGRR